MKKDFGKPGPFAFYDERHLPTLPVKEGYDLWAVDYETLSDSFDIDLLESSAYLERHAAGTRILDLGCGTGRMGAWLFKYRPRYLAGIDLSPEMLRRAGEKYVYDNLRVSDILSARFPSGSFGGIIASLVLCHVPDLSRFYARASRWLAPGGWLAIVDYHPFFLLNGIPTHFRDPSTNREIAIENHVHDLSGHFSEAAKSGFRLEEFRERYVTPDWAFRDPSLERYAGFPVSFLMIYVK